MPYLRNVIRTFQRIANLHQHQQQHRSFSLVLRLKPERKCHLRCFSTSRVLSTLRVVQAVPYDAYGVRIVFSDGSKNDFRYVWLRDCCHCHECYDREHRYRRFNTSSLDLDLKPGTMWVTDEGHLGIKWPADEHNGEEHRSIFQSKWLRRYGEAFANGTYSVTRDTSMRPSKILWDRSLLENKGLPQMTYDPFMFTQEGLREWLDLFYKFGFVILRDVPVTREALVEVANRLAYIRPVLSGSTTDVKLGPQSVAHPAETGVPLPLHTDLPYRERSPGVLMFHFMQAADPETVGTEAGGQTILSDGFFAANYLLENNMSHFQSLTTVPVPYGYSDPVTGIYYSAYWPVIGINPLGEIEEIHHCPLSRQPIQMSDDEVLPFYEALVDFGTKLKDSEIAFYLRQGDLLAMNNRRILHARTAFDPSRVARHTRMCYLDLDEVLYKYDSIIYQEAKEKQLQARD